MCLYPKLIINPKYKPNKKNGGKPPTLHDERIKYVPIGCQKCMECKRKKAREWQARLTEDIKHNTNGKFVTLTFSNKSIKELTDKIYEKNGGEYIEPYDLDNQIAIQATRYFLERWRAKYKKSLRHWLVTELGHNGTENIHMHGIIWTNEKLEEVEKIWKYGWMWKYKEDGERKINYVSEQTVNYVIKYVMKMDQDHKYYNPIILTSPGIGRDYTKTYDYQRNEYKEDKPTKETYRLRSGNEVNMPIYWRNKRYTDEQKEKLWIQKIDKEERWICGVKLKKPTANEVILLLKHFQEINKKLGYGDDTENWKEEQYEQEIRKLKQQERINNT